MRPSRSGFLCVALLALTFASAWPAFGQIAPAAPATPQQGRAGRGPLPPLGPATEPTAPRNPARHAEFLTVAGAGNIDVLFVGDSITDWWRQPQRGLPVWTKYFGSMKSANFGIAGDTTQGVLWRMRNGELDGFKARLIIHMLGTNNVNRNTNDDIVAGNRAILQEYRTRQPQAKVLLLAIFPRGGPVDAPWRAPIKAINDKLALLADNTQVFYLDIGDRFLAADGTLPADVMPDFLHPNEKGYQIWADAIIGKVNELLAPAPSSASGR
jgi:lysophospholipase L1-like esterase